MSGNTLVYLQLYLRLGLSPFPLKPRSKEPLVNGARQGRFPLEEER